MEEQSEEIFKGIEDEGRDEKTGALCRKEGDGNESTRQKEDRQAYDKMVGKSQRYREGTVRVGPCNMEVYVIKH